MGMTKSRNIPSLDGLRAISIAIVIMSHLAHRHDLPASLGFFRYYGRFGVEVFFVISGFLITHLLIREHEKNGVISLKDFYLRRFFRIFPAAYFYITFVVITAFASLSRTDIAAAYLYLSNYHRAPFILGHLWSLSVEEQFYLLWPLAMAIWFRHRKSIAIAAILIPPVLRVLLIHSVDLKDAAASYFPLVADSVAMGCLLAIVRPQLEQYTQRIGRWFVLVPIVTIAIPAMPHFISFFAYQLVGATIMRAGIALCIDRAMGKQYTWLNVRPIAWVGMISYSLYLWQELFLNPDGFAWWNRFPQNLGLVIVFAVGSYYLIEQPFLRLRERIHRGAKLSLNTEMGSATLAKS
jgi:peptidoglycan/LPS O-acetylase OafA/YrhL